MTAPAPAGPVGYSLVLPPGWAQVPVDDGADDAVRRLVDDAFRDAPPDVPPDTLASLRRRLEGSLLVSVRAARRDGGTELYLPVERLGGAVVPASFVVGEVTVDAELGSDAGQEPAAAIDPEDLVVRVLLHLAAGDGSARLVELDGAPALRTQALRPARQDDLLGVDAGSRGVDYLVSVPSSDGRWLAVSMSAAVLPDADVTDLLVELFDAVMTTFRWDVG